nr:uncharacterized protein LOC111507660 [Leptinotarsa decemlineata]
MRFTWSVVLLTPIIVTQIFAENNDCCDGSNNCCDSKTCCENYCETTTCCRSYCETITRCHSACNKICDSGCRTPKCADDCKRRCSPCPTPPNTGDSTTPSSTITPSHPTPSVVDNSNISNTNNGSVITTIMITNNITNINKIDIPVTFSNTNIQNINIEECCDTGCDGTVEPCVTTTSPTSGPYTRSPYTVEKHNVTVIHTSSKINCTNCTDQSQYSVSNPEPVPVPIPIYIKVDNPMQYPQAAYPVPQEGCCNVITPCISGPFSNCNPYGMMCGDQCSHSTMYQVTNPCISGCYKKPFAPVTSCSNFGYCQVVMRSCYFCREDFYMNYNSYQQCAGCFGM